MDKEFKSILKYAKKDNIEAKLLVAQGYEKEGKYKEAFRWYLEMAENEHSASQVKVADFYFKGLGVRQNYSKSLYWHLKALEYKEVESLSKAAYIYKEGLAGEVNLEKAFSLYKEAANLNDVDAKYNLGVMCKNGSGVEKDITQAVHWFNEASNQGHLAAKVNLGYCYCNGLGVAVDESKGIELYKEAAEKGNVTALFNLGMCYKSGYGVEKDLEKSIECFQNAGKEGHGRAFYELGIIYEEELEFKRNIGFAVDCYQRAINNGYLQASSKLAQIYFERGESKKAWLWLDKGIENQEVLFTIGKYYYDGKYVEQNYSKAVRYFSNSAKQGFPLAQYYMGLCFLYGQGLEADEERAIECLKIAVENKNIEAILLLSKIYEENELSETIELLEQAAQMGSGEAMYKMGYNYANGRFVDKDVQKAICWYQKGANLNNGQAQCNLGLAYLKGTGIGVDFRFGTYWLERAVENNSLVASLNLGYCYEKGIGVEKDYHKALKCYLFAASGGNGDAQVEVARMYEDEDPIQSIYWYSKAMNSRKDRASLGLANVYMKENNFDDNKIRMLLDNVDNKDSEQYLKAEKTLSNLLEERAKI